MAALPDNWIRAAPLRFRFRWTGTTLVVQRSMMERVYACFFLGGFVLAVAAAIDGEIGGVAIGLWVGTIGVAHLPGALKQRVVFDCAGWRFGKDPVVPWDEIQEIRLFRATSRTLDSVAQANGQGRALPAVFPRPWLAPRVDRSTLDLLCHLQHDAAHELGVAPIPVVVDLGGDEQQATFVHPCPICDAG